MDWTSILKSSTFVWETWASSGSLLSFKLFFAWCKKNYEEEKIQKMKAFREMTQHGLRFVFLEFVISFSFFGMNSMI